MGWLDYHLHEFRLLDAREQAVVSIGIPTDDDSGTHRKLETQEREDGVIVGERDDARLSVLSDTPITSASQRASATFCCYRTRIGRVTRRPSAAFLTSKRISPSADGTKSKSYVSPFPI